jgi:3D-(3,5/4)-trihydroxycyclohexane-1,2-dione acylhydrolase (decyclizing)
MATIELTAAQALVRWLQAQFVATADGEQPFFAGVWAIFGHGNVAGLGEALHAARDTLPTCEAPTHDRRGWSALQ